MLAQVRHELEEEMRQRRKAEAEADQLVSLTNLFDDHMNL